MPITLKAQAETTPYPAMQSAAADFKDTGRPMEGLRVGKWWYVPGKFDRVVDQARVNHDNISNIFRFSGLVADSFALDANWHPNPNGKVEDLALSLDKTLLFLVGGFTTIGGLNRDGIAAIRLSDGAVHPDYFSGFSQAGGITSCAVDDSGNLWIGGGFTTLNGTARNHLAMLDVADATVTVMTSMTATASGDVYDLDWDDTHKRMIVTLRNDGTIGGAGTCKTAAVSKTGTVAWRKNPNPGTWTFQGQTDGALVAVSTNGSNKTYVYDAGTGTENYWYASDGNNQGCNIYKSHIFVGHHGDWVRDGKNLPGAKGVGTVSHGLYVINAAGLLQTWMPQFTGYPGTQVEGLKVFSVGKHDGSGQVLLSGDWKNIQASGGTGTKVQPRLALFIEIGSDGTDGTGTSDTTAPTVPTGLTQDSVTTTNVTFHWTASTDMESGVDHYEVMRAPGASGGTFATIASNVTTTSYTDTGLTANTTYRYKVKAVDVAGNPSAASAALQVTTDTTPVGDVTPPTTPAGLTGTATYNSVALSWTASTDASGIHHYNVYRDTVKVGETPSNGTTYTDATVSPDTSYSYTVQAVDNSSNRNAGSQSTAFPITTPAGPSTPKRYKWQSRQPWHGGHFTGLAVDPVTPGTLYLAGDVGGIRRSTDYGDSFEWFQRGLYQEAHRKAATIVAAISPKGAITRVVAGFGDNTPGGTATLDAPSLTWGKLNGPVTFASQNADPLLPAKPRSVKTLIAIDASNNGLGNREGYIYAGQFSQGLARSTDGGANYTVVGLIGEAIRHVTLNPADPKQVFVGTKRTTPGGDGVAPPPPPTTADVTAPTTPGTPTFSGTTSSATTLSWTASTDAVGVHHYVVSRALGAGAYADIATDVVDPTFTDEGLTASTTYNYKVKALDAAGNVSAWSGAGNVTTSAAAGDTEAPTRPLNVQLVGQPTTSQVVIAWDASTDNVGVTKYIVRRGGVKIGESTGLQYTDATVAAQTTYTYTVRASDAAGNLSTVSPQLVVSTPSASITAFATNRTKIGALVGGDTLGTYSRNGLPSTGGARMAYLEELYGYKYEVVRVFRNWTEGSWNAAYERNAALGGRGLWMSEKARDGGDPGPAILYDEIADGLHDAHIELRADEIKALNAVAPIPFILFTFQHEPEGEQDDDGTSMGVPVGHWATTSYGTQGAAFKAAFARYRQVMLARLASNVTTLTGGAYTGEVKFGPIFYAESYDSGPAGGPSGSTDGAYLPANSACDFYGADNYNWSPAPEHGGNPPNFWRELSNAQRVGSLVNLAKRKNKRACLGEIGCFEREPASFQYPPPPEPGNTNRWDSTTTQPRPNNVGDTPSGSANRATWGQGPPYDRYPPDPVVIARDPTGANSTKSKAAWVDHARIYVASQKLNDGVTPVFGVICWYDTAAVYNWFTNTSPEAIAAIQAWHQDASIVGPAAAPMGMKEAKPKTVSGKRATLGPLTAGTVNATGKGSATMAVTLAMPTVVAGQVMLAHVNVKGASGLASTPAGWSQIATSVISRGTGQDLVWSAVYQRTAVAADSGANVTFTGATPTSGINGAIRVNIVAMPTGLSVASVATAGGANSNAVAAPAVANRKAGDQVLQFVGTNAGPRPWANPWNGTTGGSILGVMPVESYGKPVSGGGVLGVEGDINREIAMGHSMYPHASANAALKNLGVPSPFPEAAGSATGVTADWEDGRMSYVSWPQQEAWLNAGTNGTTLKQQPGRPPHFDLEDIAKGVHDAKIYNWFVKLRQWRQPTYFRLMWEFNGGDPPWAIAWEDTRPGGNNLPTWSGNKTTWCNAFKAAWKRIYIIAKGTDAQIATLGTIYTGASAFTVANSSAGAENLYFVWNRQEFESSSVSSDAMHPGDQWTDFVATELYTQQGDRADTTRVDYAGSGAGAPHTKISAYGTATHGSKRFAPGEGGMRWKGGADNEADALARAEAFRTMAKNFPQSAAFMWWDEGDINKNGVSKFSSQTASVLTKLIDVFGDAVWNPSLDVTFAPIATPFVEVIQGRAPVGKAKTNYGPDQVGAAIYRRALTADGSTGAVAPTMYGFGEWTAITVVMSGTVEPVDTTPPSVPTGIGSSGTTSTSTTISWTASSDAESGVASYLVNRDGTDIATVTSGTAYTDTGLAPSTGYVYKVKAVNGVGLASAYSSTTSVTTLADSGDTTDPSTPTGLQAPVGQLSATQVGLTWNASTDNVGVDHYDVIRGGVVIGQSTSTAYTDTTVSPSTTYTFKVRAVDAAGNASADSTGVTVTTPASTSLPTPVGAWGFDTVV